MDVEQIKGQARVNWGRGEYSWLSEVLRPASEALADACAVSAGQEVLDVAAGDGNFAIVCAREGASVVACDLSPEMVARGRGRSEAEGLDIEWAEADAEALPFEDARFDCAGSVFGAMIAPRPRVAAEELFRVVRPGNTVGMTVWEPEALAPRLFQIGRRYNPPPPDLPLLEEWGREEVIAERFDGLANTIDIERRTLPWGASSPDEFMALMERHAPIHVTAMESMDPGEYASMRSEAVDLLRAEAGGDGPFSLDVGYLVVVARRRG